MESINHVFKRMKAKMNLRSFVKKPRRSHNLVRLLTSSGLLVFALAQAQPSDAVDSGASATAPSADGLPATSSSPVATQKQTETSIPTPAADAPAAAKPTTPTSPPASSDDSEEDDDDEPESAMVPPAPVTVPSSAPPVRLDGKVETVDSLKPLNQEFSKYGIEFGREDNGGRLVGSVKAGSRADGWGIKTGDILRNIKTPAKVKVERNGKSFDADLTVDKAIYTAVKKMAGQYVGRVSVPTEEIGPGSQDFHSRNTAPMVTQFFANPGAIITGSYAESHNGTCDGFLTDAKVTSPTDVYFTWKDRAGTGYLMVRFAPDYKSFNGAWNYIQCTGHSEFVKVYGPSTRLLRWDGKRI